MKAVTYVHGHTTDTRPAVPLGLVLVVSTTGLQDGLVNTTTTSNNTFTEHITQMRNYPQESVFPVYYMDHALYNVLSDICKHVVAKE